MPIIHLETLIKAPIEKIFDLSRSIDIHAQSLAFSDEEAIAGVTSGLIEMNERVTWRAKHFRIYWKMTIEITALEKPEMFVDEMVRGPFKSIKHTHLFESTEVGTRMIDKFEYVAPLGLLGKLADLLFLEKYMTNLLLKRNLYIQQIG